MSNELFYGGFSWVVFCVSRCSIGCGLYKHLVGCILCTSDFPVLACCFKDCIEDVAEWMNDSKLKMNDGGRNSSIGSVLGSLSCLMQRCGFDTPPRRIFPVEGIFPLELTWVLTPFPQNSFGWGYKPRSSLYSHAFHRTDSKDPDIHVLDGWMNAGNKSTPSMHHPRRRNVTTSMVGLKTVAYAEISPKMVNPRDIAGERRRRRRWMMIKVSLWPLTPGQNSVRSSLSLPLCPFLVVTYHSLNLLETLVST